MKHRITTKVLAACLVWVAMVSAAAAQCRLALVLALDVSSSVDAEEYGLQRDGLAAALLDERVASAILEGPGDVAIAVFEWSGRTQQAVLQDWVFISSRADLERLAAQILGARRSYAQFPTALGYALGFASGLLERAPVCDRKVVDVSGDGITNDGFRPSLAYRHFPFDDVTVNGLVVTGDDGRVQSYYRQEVIHGPLAFVEVAEGYRGFKDAMARKLYRETRTLTLGDNRR